MASTSKVFQKYKRPATATKGDERKRSRSASEVQLLAVDISIPDDFDSSLLQENIPPQTTLLQPNQNKKRGSLRVSDQNFQLINSCINQIYPLAQRRASIMRLHDSSVAAVNKKEMPRATRINDRPPVIQGLEYPTIFQQQYKAKCLYYSMQLGLLLIEEHKSQVTKLTSEIDQAYQEVEAKLAAITDIAEKEKAETLLEIKFQSALKKSTRPKIQAHRRRQQKQD